MRGGFAIVDKPVKTSSGNLWVLAYDKETDERVGIACCPKGQVAFHKAKFESDGFSVEVLTGEEVDALIATDAECGLG